VIPLLRMRYTFPAGSLHVSSVSTKGKAKRAST
jgi:hypothetical protein